MVIKNFLFDTFIKKKPKSWKMSLCCPWSWNCSEVICHSHRREGGSLTCEIYPVTAAASQAYCAGTEGLCPYNAPQVLMLWTPTLQQFKGHETEVEGIILFLGEWRGWRGSTDSAGHSAQRHRAAAVCLPILPVAPSLPLRSSCTSVKPFLSGLRACCMSSAVAALLSADRARERTSHISFCGNRKV